MRARVIGASMAVLSLQSFVTYGHVGNSAALPPLQAQGFEIWPLPTAILAHHPGHGRPAARTTPPNEVEASRWPSSACWPAAARC